MALNDFSELPDVTWVQVLKYLPLSDRYHVSLTCSTLYEVFKHPSLWHTQTLHIYGDSSDYTDPDFQSSMLGPFLNVTRYFGKYFQNLTLRVSGHLCDIHEELQDILLEVGRCCRLETLNLDIGVLTNEFYKVYVEPPTVSAILAIASFVKNAFRMRHLHIQSWPLYERIDNEECNVFKAMLSNQKLEQLETLTLFMTGSKGWSERAPCLITPQETFNVLSHFMNLSHIGLRTPMLTEETLQMLANPERARLTRLDIFIHYLDPVRSGRTRFGIPTVSTKTWRELLRRNPDLSVNLSVFLRVSHMELANMLKPEVPIASIVFMKYAKIDTATISLLYNHNQQTLTSYHSYCDSYDLDPDLIAMVTNCENLIEFVHHGDIKAATVVKLAKERGQLWKKFEVVRDRIKVPDEFEDIDEDQVIAPDRDGNLVLVGLMRHHRSPEEATQVINNMAAEVSQALGYTWQPV